VTAIKEMKQGRGRSQETRCGRRKKRPGDGPAGGEEGEVEIK
jgi:hypothetical protein